MRTAQEMWTELRRKVDQIESDRPIAPYDAPEGATRRALVKLWQAFEWEFEGYERRVMSALFGRPDPAGPIARLRLARQRLIWDLAAAEFGPDGPRP